jgi:Fe2+ or Zn2+ uptake regulation protein
VYRTLNSLAELGVVRHVHVGHGPVGHGPAVYHLADDHHSHLVCHGCGVVIEVPTDLLAAPARRVLADHGFALDTGHVALSGLCTACSCQPGEPGREP